MNSGTIILVIINMLRIYSYLILAKVLLSWFVRNPYSRLFQLYVLLTSLTEPLLGPIRRILPAMGGWDFSAIVAFLLIDIGIRFLYGIL